MPVVHIDIDSIRPDHIGAYGYAAETTPNIDAFASDAVRFENAYVADSPCMPSRAGFLSGRYGIHNGVVTHGSRAQILESPHNWDSFEGEAGDWATLPELFFDAHIPTCAISSFPRHPAKWFYHVWEEFRHPREPRTSSTGNPEYFQTPRAETVADHAIEYITTQDADDFLLYVQFWDPHLPYNRSTEQVEAVRDHSLLPEYPTADQIDAHQEWDAYFSATDEHRAGVSKDIYVEDRADLATLYANYDAEIRYVDRHVGRVLDALRREGVFDETFVSISGDHGEEFGEHGLYSCHWSVHEGTQRVPLLLKPPATSEYSVGTRDALVTNVDLAATIADYAGFEIPAGWQGATLRPVLDGSGGAPHEYLVLGHGLVTAQRAVRTPRWKFIRTYHPGMWPGTEPEYQLYDIVDDPWEQQDLSDTHQETVADLEAKLHGWIGAHSGDAGDPLLDVAEGGPSMYNEQVGQYEGVEE